MSYFIMVLLFIGCVVYSNNPMSIFLAVDLYGDSCATWLDYLLSSRLVDLKLEDLKFCNYMVNQINDFVNYKIIAPCFWLQVVAIGALDVEIGNITEM